MLKHKNKQALKSSLKLSTNKKNYNTTAGYKQRPRSSQGFVRPPVSGKIKNTQVR
jgi:hypothetical protein